MHNDILEHSVSTWHRWNDRPGFRYAPSYYSTNGAVVSPYGNILHSISTVEEAFTVLCNNELYCFSDNILNTQSFPLSTPLLKHHNTTPYVSKSGHVAALRLATKRKSGYFIPTTTWADSDPCVELLQAITRLFVHFGYQAVTPSSLSEKVLRATLPHALCISRPSVLIRNDILANRNGARIDKVREDFQWVMLDDLYTYDVRKDHLYQSQLVPSPFEAPFTRIKPSLASILQYATGYYFVTLEPCTCVISPILDCGKKPKVRFTKWLWREEIEDCLEAGYTFVECAYGHSFNALSDFMSAWAAILWQAYIQLDSELDRSIIKRMMVGLPGRFLRSPEIYKLLPISEYKDGDVTIDTLWKTGDDNLFPLWCVRSEQNVEDTALTPIGDYIVMKSRQNLYHMMLAETQNGNTVLNSYVDCYSTLHPTTIDRLGVLPGQTKERRYTRVMLEENRFIGVDASGELDVRAPGIGGKKRIEFIRRYREVS